MLPKRDPVIRGARVLSDPQRVLAVALQAYIAIDAAGRVAAWNPAAQATFGYTHDEACGEDLAELIILVRYRAAHRAGLSRPAGGQPGRALGKRLQLTALHRDGHESRWS
jgi:PAS domain S-box-containing protein